MIEVTLNGERRRLGDGATVTDAVRAAGLAGDARGLAVALDGEVIPHAEWDARRLASGHELEIVQAIQGG